MFDPITIGIFVINLALVYHVFRTGQSPLWLAALGLPVVYLGNGTNVLVSDAGVRGVVVKIGGSLTGLEVVGADLVAEAGESLAAVGHVAADAGLSFLSRAEQGFEQLDQRARGARVVVQRVLDVGLAVGKTGLPQVLRVGTQDHDLLPGQAGPQHELRRPDLGGERLGHPDQAGLGGGIIALAGIARRAYDGADRDDSAVAAAHHRLHGGARQAEGRGQVDGEHAVPILVLEAHEQVVARDAGIVDEDVDRPRPGQRPGDPLSPALVEGNEGTAAPAQEK
mgnify:CR=1 FL=1